MSKLKSEKNRFKISSFYELIKKISVSRLLFSIVFSIAFFYMSKVVFLGFTFNENYMEKFYFSDYRILLIWIPITYLVLYLIEKYYNKAIAYVVGFDNSRYIKKFCIYSFILMFGIYLLYFLTFYPGGVYTDTWVSLQMLTGETEMTLQQPVLYTLMLNIVVDRNTGLDVLKQQGAIDAEFAVLPTTHFVETHTHVSYIGVDREVAIEGIAGAHIHAPNDTAFINFDGIVATAGGAQGNGVTHIDCGEGGELAAKVVATQFNKHGQLGKSTGGVFHEFDTQSDTRLFPDLPSSHGIKAVEGSLVRKSSLVDIGGKVVARDAIESVPVRLDVFRLGLCGHESGDSCQQQ